MKYDQAILDSMADIYVKYLYFLKKYIVLEGLDKKIYKKHVKRIKKMIKHLRNGEGDKVLIPERYLAYVEKYGK